MNKKLIPLIGIGALAGSAACLLAKLVRQKKKAAMKYDFDDEFTFDDDDDFRSGYIPESDLRDALRLLFRTYPDYRITGFDDSHGCTADELREYWANFMASLLQPILNDSWEASPRLEAFDTKVQMPSDNSDNLFHEPACILVNDTVDCIDDPSCSVEHNLQLWITVSGELAIVHMFGISQGEAVLGYSHLDYTVGKYSFLPWSFNELISKLFYLIYNGHAW